jgi:hypothetical protein
MQLIYGWHCKTLLSGESTHNGLTNRNAYTNDESIIESARYEITKIRHAVYFPFAGKR